MVHRGRQTCLVCEDFVVMGDEEIENTFAGWGPVRGCGGAGFVPALPAAIRLLGCLCEVEAVADGAVVKSHAGILPWGSSCVWREQTLGRCAPDAGAVPCMD